jgi:hypothetical protein
MRGKALKMLLEHDDAVAAVMRLLTALTQATPARPPHKLGVMWREARRIWLEKPADPTA